MSEWVETNLGEAANLVNKKPAQFKGTTQYLATSDVVGFSAIPSETVSFLNRPSRAGVLLSDGDVLQAKMKGTNKAYHVSINMNGWLASTGFAQFKPSIVGNSSDYIYNFISGEYFLKERDRLSVGSTQQAISDKDLKSICIKLPSCIREQNKIADVLSSCNVSIKKTEELINKHQQIKAGLMHDLFTRGITADGKLRPPREQAPELYQETPIGWIPKEWIYEEFGKKISVIDPNPSHRYPVEVPDGVPICSTENFYGEDGFIFKKSKLVEETTYINQNNRCRFSANDVIFARKGKIGLARRYGKGKKVFSHTVVVMKPADSTTDSSWLLWLTRSDWLLKAIDVTMNTNSGVPTLGVEFIKNIEVPFPSKNEQIAITKKLDGLSDKVQIEIEKRDKLKKQRSGLMHDLLTGEVPVTINPGDAND